MKKFMAMAVLCLGIVASVRPAEAEVPEEPKDVFADVAEFIDAFYFRGLPATSKGGEKIPGSKHDIKHFAHVLLEVIGSKHGPYENASQELKDIFKDNKKSTDDYFGASRMTPEVADAQEAVKNMINELLLHSESLQPGSSYTQGIEAHAYDVLKYTLAVLYIMQLRVLKGEEKEVGPASFDYIKNFIVGVSIMAYAQQSGLPEEVWD